MFTEHEAFSALVFSIQAELACMEFFGGLLQITGKPWVLWALMGVHIGRNIPGLLVAKRFAQSQRHIVFDEGAAVSILCMPAPQL